MAHNPDFDANQVAKYIKNTGDVIESLKGKTRYNRKLNSYRALSILDQNVGATGVVANNTSNLPSNSFSAEKFKYQKEKDPSKTSLSKFSSALLAKIKRGQRHLNSAEEDRNRQPNQQKADEVGKKP